MYQAVLGRQKHVIAQFNLGLAYLAMGDLAAANATYAAAIAEFGAEEAERIGADSDLRELARNSKTRRERTRAAAQVLAEETVNEGLNV